MRWLAILWLFLGAALAAEPVAVSVDFARPLSPYPQITNWFGYDESNYTTMPLGRALLSDLHDAYPVPVYIRAHHLFTSGDGVGALKWSSTNLFTLGPDGKPVYNFVIIDQIFDAYKAAGVRPMVELGFMPKDLSRKPEPYQITFGKGEMLDSGAQEPPKDYAVWSEMVRVFTAHLVARYGAADARQWYWEVWNEPDIPYWHGTQEEYFKLYDYAVAGVRAALPGAKVGGPATTSPRGEKGAAFLKAFLAHCAHDHSMADGNTVPLDFISFHAKGQPAIVDGHVRMGLDKELADVREGFGIVAGSPFAKLPIILSEADPEGCAACSMKINPSNAYRNGALYAAYTAAVHKAMLELAARYDVNLIALLSWSFEFENTGYFEGYRSLASNGIAKPVLNFFRMAGMMSGQRVAATSSGAVALDEMMAHGVHAAPTVDVLAALDQHHAAVMLWNYSDDNLGADAVAIKLALTGLPDRRLKLFHYRIDDSHSNAYTRWLQMGSPQAPTPEKIAALKAAGGLALLETPRWVKGRALLLNLTLPRQAVSLLVLEW
ncbi:MAG: hypothetical protein P4L57_02555 [Rhizomicrobium sp.]|nr:hypothetical protein [Rhizomicrobium sp.]